MLVAEDRHEAYERWAIGRLAGRAWTAREVADACGVKSAPQGSRIRAAWVDKYAEDLPEERQMLHLADAAADPEGDVHAAV